MHPFWVLILPWPCYFTQIIATTLLSLKLFEITTTNFHLPWKCYIHPYSIAKLFSVSSIKITRVVPLKIPSLGMQVVSFVRYLLVIQANKHPGIETPARKESPFPCEPKHTNLQTSGIFESSNSSLKKGSSFFNLKTMVNPTNMAGNYFIYWTKDVWSRPFSDKFLIIYSFINSPWNMSISFELLNMIPPLTRYSKYESTPAPIPESTAVHVPEATSIWLPT